MSLHSPHPSFTMEQQKDSTGALASQDLHHVIAHVHHELRTLTQRRVAIVKRIAMIKQAIAGLDTLFGPGILDEELATRLAPPSCRHRDRRLGLTNCCRQVLRRENANPLTLEEMLKLIREQHPEILVAHKTPSNSVRTVLRRLVSYGEAAEGRPKKGLLTWQAIPPPVLDRDNGNNSGSVTYVGS